MNLVDVFNTLENDENFKSYIDKILKKYKKTKVDYLESLNHLGYLLYLDKREDLAEQLLDTLAKIPFEGDYDYWSFIESSIILLAFIQGYDKNKVLELRTLLLDTLDYGDDFTKRINLNVHKRFLSGSTLEHRISKIEQASNVISEMEYRMLYLSDLLKLNLFIDESAFEEKDIHVRINDQIIQLQKFIEENGIFTFFPFKG